MNTAERALAGKRVLIVEDELLVAMMIEDLLGDFGCITIGPYGTVSTAMHAVETESPDLALLDVNLNGERVYPVAEALTERHVPFLFLSGYGEEAIPPGRTGWKVCAKPFKWEELARMLCAAVDTTVT